MCIRDRDVFCKVNIVHSKEDVSSMVTSAGMLTPSLALILCKTLFWVCPSIRRSHVYSTDIQKPCKIFITFLLRIAWRITNPTASCCGISCTDLTDFDFLLLTWSLDKNMVSVLWARPRAFWFTCDVFSSVESDECGPWSTHRKKQYSSVGKCLLVTSLNEPVNVLFSDLPRAFLKMEAALYQGIALASDIGHLTDKKPECPIEIPQRCSNVLLNSKTTCQ